MIPFIDVSGMRRQFSAENLLQLPVRTVNDVKQSRDELKKTASRFEPQYVPLGVDKAGSVNWSVHDIQFARAGESIQEIILQGLAQRRNQSKICFESFWHTSCPLNIKINLFWRYTMRVAKITISIFLATVFSLAIAVPESGHAQEPSSQPARVEDGQLRSFAKVYVQVEKIRQTYGPQLKETQDPEKGMEIQKEAKSKIDNALAKEGMTVESYSQTIQKVNGDDELRKKALEMIDQERTKP